MGPHSFKCGKSENGKLTDCAMARFNGAALFQVRKERIVWNCAGDYLKLQWGRTLSSAERWKYSPANDAADSFNGAALFQVRKVHNPYIELSDEEASFNGAALFQVRKGPVFPAS